MTRTFRLAFVAALLLGLLAGCAAPTVAPAAPAGEEGAAPAAPAEGVTTLDFWMVSDATVEPYFRSIVAEFNAAHPDVEIVFAPYANEAYKTALQVAIASDDPPDIFFNWAGEDAGRLVREGHVADMTALAESAGWREHVSPAGLDAFTFDGKLYAAPYSLEAKYWYYNLDLFEREGLSVPSTFDELLALCTTLQERGITPAAFGNQERWEGVHYLSLFNQRVVGEDQIAADYSLTPPADELFTDPNYAEAFQRLLDMQDAGCFGEAVNSTTPDAAVAQFFTEQTAMYYQGSWAMGNLNANEFAGKYGMFLMPPMTDAAGNQSYMLMGPIGLQVAEKTPNKEAAFAFVDFFLSQENQARLVAELQRLPVRDDATTEETDPLIIQVTQDLATAEGAAHWLDVVLENSVSEAYLNSIQEVLAGTMTPEQAQEAVRQAAVTAKERLGR